MNKINNMRGYSLVELLGVVAIISILAAIAILGVGLTRCALLESAVSRQVQSLNSAYQSYISVGGPTSPDMAVVLQSLHVKYNNVGPFLPSETDSILNQYIVFDGKFLKDPDWVCLSPITPSAPTPIPTPGPTPTPTATPSSGSNIGVTVTIIPDTILVGESSMISLILTSLDGQPANGELMMTVPDPSVAGFPIGLAYDPWVVGQSQRQVPSPVDKEILWNELLNGSGAPIYVDEAAVIATFAPGGTLNDVLAGFGFDETTLMENYFSMTATGLLPPTVLGSLTQLLASEDGAIYLPGKEIAILTERFPANFGMGYNWAEMGTNAGLNVTESFTWSGAIGSQSVVIPITVVADNLGSYTFNPVVTNTSSGVVTSGSATLSVVDAGSVPVPVPTPTPVPPTDSIIPELLLPQQTATPLPMATPFAIIAGTTANVPLNLINTNTVDTEVPTDIEVTLPVGISVFGGGWTISGDVSTGQTLTQTISVGKSSLERNSGVGLSLGLLLNTSGITVSGDYVITATASSVGQTLTTSVSVPIISAPLTVSFASATQNITIMPTFPGWNVSGHTAQGIVSAQLNVSRNSVLTITASLPPELAIQDGSQPQYSESGYITFPTSASASSLVWANSTAGPGTQNVVFFYIGAPLLPNSANQSGNYEIEITAVTADSGVTASTTINVTVVPPPIIVGIPLTISALGTPLLSQPASSLSYVGFDFAYSGITAAHLGIQDFGFVTGGSNSVLGDTISLPRMSYTGSFVGSEIAPINSSSVVTLWATIPSGLDGGVLTVTTQSLAAYVTGPEAGNYFGPPMDSFFHSTGIVINSVSIPISRANIVGTAPYHFRQYGSGGAYMLPGASVGTSSATFESRPGAFFR